MTTVAAKDGWLVADTQLTGPDNIIYRAQKIVRLRDGGVAGGAGDWREAYMILCWLEQGQVGDPPEFDGATILILRPDGSIWVADDAWPAYPLLNDHAAIGCGAKAAMALMDEGKSAAKAVAAVTGVDAATSAPLQQMRVKRA